MAAVRTLALLRIVRTAKEKRHWAPIAGFVSSFKPTLPAHAETANYYSDGPRLVWSTARCASSEAIQSHHAAPTVKCTADRRKVKVFWPDGEDTYHSVWLRHNCTCPMCWDVIPKQKLVSAQDLIGDPTIHSVEVCESQNDTGSLSITWSYSNGSEHHGKIDLALLKKNSYSLATIRKKQQSNTQLATTTLPRLSYSEVLKGEEGVWKWMQHVNENGVCLLTDVPAQLEQIKKVAEEAKLKLRETLYGWLYDVTAKDKATVLAFTPSALPLHNDLLYYESPPGLQFIHCVRNDACVEGGDSVLLDAFAVIEEMREKHPQHFATLTRVPATFERKPTTGPNNPPSYRYRRPHILLDRYSRKVTGFFWSPPTEGPLFAPEEDVEAFYEAYTCLATMLAESNLKIYHRLEPGEVLTLINRRFLHGRTSFKLNGGKRHLQGCFVGIEDFNSRVRILASQFSPDYEVKTAFDQDVI